MPTNALLEQGAASSRTGATWRSSAPWYGRTDAVAERRTSRVIWGLVVLLWTLFFLAMITLWQKAA